MMERLLDIPWYLFVAGCLEFAALVAISAVALVRLPSWGVIGYAIRIQNWTMFAVLLLVCGCIANSAFMLITYGRMYVSADLIVDFFPFIPFGQWNLESSAYEHGKLLNGTSMRQIQFIWAGCAAATWAAAIVLYRAYLRERVLIREEEERYLRRRHPRLS